MTITLAKLNWRDGAHVIQVDETTGEFEFKQRRYRLDPRGDSFAIQRFIKRPEPEECWFHVGMVAKFSGAWTAVLSAGDTPAQDSLVGPYHAAIKALMRA